MSRIGFLCLVSLVSMSGTLVAKESRAHAELDFVRALEKFDSAQTPSDYHDAADILESLLATGMRNGAVYYNLGNAYYRAGEFGRAILNYRKAKPYRPRDPYLNANLEQALAAAPGRLAEPARPWWSHVLFWSQWLAYPTKVRLFFATAAMAALATAVANLLHRGRLYSVAIGLLAVSLAIGIDAALCQSDVDDTTRAVITGETVARKGTGNSYEPAFDQPLRDGAEFQILKSTADWTFGHFEGIGDGWIRNEFMAR